MSDILGDTHLKYLRTKYNYGKLDNAINYCKDDTFYIEAVHELSKNPGLEDASEKILKAMCYMYTEKRYKKLDSDMCNFFYYWLADVLLKNIDKKNFASEVLINLYSILNKAGVDKICDPLDIYIDNDYFKYIKLIFDYSEDYVNYELHLAKPNSLCNEQYREYLQTYVRAYKDLHTKCITENQNKIYCHAFRNSFDTKRHDLLSTWTCYLDETEIKVNLLGDRHDSSVGPPQIQRTAEGEAHREQLKEAKEEGVGFAGPNILQASPLDTTVSEAETDNVSLSSDDPPPSPITKSIASAASAAGLLVPPFLVYNFTPAGAWINKLLGRNQMNRSPVTEAQLIENFHQPEYFNSERSRYNIAYRPG